ncbi:MAG: MBL fold metallo-hydrolase [Rhizobiales bacterium]|nr:MBL fold metallo-hydrolase [Hyphomicrobiales bacterium]
MSTSAAEKLNAREVAFNADLAAIRELASVLPGAMPVAINGIKVAASIRPRKFVIEGGDDTPVIMPRTAYQIVYPDGAIMIDSGLDRETHNSFGGDEPYYPDQFVKLQRALDRARLIVLTHFHADHVAGVVRAPNFRELARKTVITAETADFMVNRPHRPHLQLTEDAADNFIVMSYRKYYPVAPGVVLIKAAGHSPDMQMIYIRLQSGHEILHSIDAAWNLDNILQVKGKAAPWVKEDVPAIMGQLRWLKHIHETEKTVTVLVTHDDGLFNRVTSSGLVGGALALD